MKFARLLAIAFAVTLLSISVVGCTQSAEKISSDDPVELAPVVIGTLPTEDALPLWVAEDEGLFEAAGIDSVEIVTFQSAMERDTAFAAGEIDAFMGDIIAAAQLESSGMPVTIATIMLGATPKDGRFGIVTGPESEYTDLAGLADVPVGTSSNTIQEYVLDGLMRAAEVPADSVVKEEVDKVPVRFDLVMQGQLAAAALPEPLLSLAEFQGGTILANDTEGENLSQTVLVFSDEYLAATGGIETMATMLDVWDEAIVVVNADPDAWRDTLVEKARLPEPIKTTYEISVYAEHQVPTTERIDAVLAWMEDNELLMEPVTFEDLVLVTP